MSVPKSVTKIKVKKGNVEVEYTSDVDKCNYYIHELCRGALRDSSKFILKAFRTSYYSVFKKHTGKAGKVSQYTVYSNQNTKYPHVDIGLKSGKVDGFYAYFQEVGTSKQRRLGLLSKTVESNVDQIIEIQSQYLSRLNDEEPNTDIEENDVEGGE